MIVRFGLILFIAVFICFVVSPVYAELVNGGFEISEPNAMLGFDLPVGWTSENYTAVFDNFIPEPPQGHTDSWLIDMGIGLNSFEGVSFVVLSTENYYPSDPSLLRQVVNVSANERISGAYFFGTCDYIPYKDFATISLVPTGESELRNIILVHVDVEDVGSFGSMGGWMRFEYVFSEAEAGLYQLELSVSNMNDKIFPSYLAVDDIRICDVPEYGDINYDCHVNLGDFALLSSEWLCDCTDPNDLPDPNDCPWTDLGGGDIQVDLTADIDGDMMVDVDDLDKMGTYWLSEQDP